MRTIKYRIWYGTGNNSAPWLNEKLEKFILEVVATRHVDGFVIPPLHFVNEILMSGETNAGMAFNGNHLRSTAMNTKNQVKFFVQIQN